MTFPLARAKLVSIIEGVTGLDSRLYSDDLKFRHLPEGRSGIDCRSRSFWLEANVDGDGSITGPFTPDLSGQPRQTFTMTLTVCYRDSPSRRSTLDEVLALDQRALSVALLQPSAWSTATSGILSLTTSEALLPWRRAYLPGDRVELRGVLAMQFR
jgi:hypothetical protein